jgi:hypothetical protein
VKFQAIFVDIYVGSHTFTNIKPLGLFRGFLLLKKQKSIILKSGPRMDEKKIG